MKNENIYDIKDMYRKLSELFGDRLIVSSLTDYSMEGFIDSFPFEITYIKDECLIISISKRNNNKILNEMRDVIRIITGKSEVLCCYEDSVNEDDKMFAVEWNFKNPDERIRNLVNVPSTVNNLRLLNGRNVQEYVKPGVKIYGLYPGCLYNLEKVNNYSEVELYHAIDRISGHIHRVQDAMRYGKPIDKDIDLEEEEYALEYLVNLTRKFGVDIPEPSINGHMQPTESYWKFIRFYDHHFKHVLTDEEWYAYNLGKRQHIDVSILNPKENWQDAVIPVRKR